MAIVNNRLEDFSVSILTFIWQERIHCSACYIFESDFEVAVLRAVTAVFGRHINHQGCFYHLTQASWRQIQQLGLVPLYKNELVVTALAHVVGSGITVNCGIMYVPNGWWKHRWATC
jgi:hypothetical protein